MRRLTAATLLLFFALLGWSPASAGTVAEICFVPSERNCADVVIREIDGARTRILVQAYGFTHAGIVEALIRARKRGVAVQIILDRSNVCAEGEDDCGRKGRHAANALHHAGAEVSIDATHAIAHNKVIVIDWRRVITGSMNWTAAGATKNAENVVVLEGLDTAQPYARNWQAHRDHSKPYAP